MTLPVFEVSSSDNTRKARRNPSRMEGCKSISSSPVDPEPAGEEYCFTLASTDDQRSPLNGPVRDTLVPTAQNGDRW